MEGFDSPFGTKERDISLNHEKLVLEHELGHGNFGSVMKGTYTLSNGKTISVAVRTLREKDIPEYYVSELLHEADIMAKLVHPNIVRLVGVVQNPSLMIAMELAPLGPLNKYLKKHREMTLLNILILMLQVDEGMCYLETQHFVHRDLAARNVLVFSENLVKISEFNMSRAMDAENEYIVGRAGPLPLEWYAPEYLFYNIFTSKGDVWSYGITLWECVTYGGKPYQGMKRLEIVERLESNYRLPCPERCPDEIYNIMRKCWEWKQEDRPTFLELGGMLSKYIEKERLGKS